MRDMAAYFNENIISKKTIKNSLYISILLFFFAFIRVNAADFTDKPVSDDGSVKATLSGNILTINGTGDISRNKWDSLKNDLVLDGFWADASSKIIFAANSGEKISIKGTGFQGMFKEFKGKEIRFNKALDTSELTKTGNMFNSCSNIISLDISDWDVSKVSNMAQMFYACDRLTSLDLSYWDTSSLTTMSSMFLNCKNIENINIKNFDTSKVERMNNTFYACNKIALDISNWDTSSLKSCAGMFRRCKSPIFVDLSSWDTSNVTSASLMFDESLVDADISN